MATDIKITVSPETYQSLTSLLQMLKFGGTDTRAGEARDAFMSTMNAQGRKLRIIGEEPGTHLFPEILAFIAEQILGDIQGGK